jgi:hypothetical protein
MLIASEQVLRDTLEAMIESVAAEQCNDRVLMWMNFDPTTLVDELNEEYLVVTVEFRPLGDNTYDFLLYAS